MQVPSVNRVKGTTQEAHTQPAGTPRHGASIISTLASVTKTTASGITALGRQTPLTFRHRLHHALLYPLLDPNAAR